MERLLEKAMEELRKEKALRVCFDLRDYRIPVVMIDDIGQCTVFECCEDLAECLVINATGDAYHEELFEIFSTKCPTDRQLWEFIKSGKADEKRVSNEMPNVLEWWTVKTCEHWRII